MSELATDLQLVSVSLVPITDRDLAAAAEHTGLGVERLREWLASDEQDDELLRAFLRLGVGPIGKTFAGGKKNRSDGAGGGGGRLGGMLKPDDVPKTITVPVTCELLDSHVDDVTSELCVTYRVAREMIQAHDADELEGMLAETRIPIQALQDAPAGPDKLVDLVRRAIGRDVGEAMADYKAKLKAEQG